MFYSIKLLGFVKPFLVRCHSYRVLGLVTISLFIGFPAVLHASSHNASATLGSFSVNEGTANYSVPIEIPPGMAGMEPSLSLNYSSGGSNGLAGVGWAIGALKGSEPFKSKAGGWYGDK